MALTRDRSHSAHLAGGVRLFLVLLGLAVPAAAADWTGLGPPGGTVTALAEAPAPSTTIYAGLTDAGVFRSTDDGRTWQPARSGIFAREIYVLTVDPQTPSTVLAGTERGIYRTTDGGATWTHEAAGLPPTPVPESGATVAALAFRPDAPQVVYAGIGDSVWTSADGGESWAPAASSPKGVVTDLVIDPSAPGALLAATSQGLFRSDDDARSWQSLAVGADPDLGLSRYASDLAFDPTAPGTLYAALVGASPNVVKSLDGGATWQAVGSGLPSGTEARSAGWVLAVDPVQPDTVLVATELGLYRSERGGGSRTWIPVFRPPHGSSGARYRLLTVLATRSGAVLMGLRGPDGESFGLGVTRSPDGRTGWTTIRAGLAAAVEKLVPDPRGGGVLYAVRFDGAVVRSENGGTSWAEADAGLDGEAVVDLAVDPTAPDVLYASTTGPEGFFRSSDRGRSWQGVGGGEVCCEMRLGAIPPASEGGSTFLLAVARDGRVLRSLDRGASFELVGHVVPGTFWILGKSFQYGIEASSPSAVYLWTLLVTALCDPGPVCFDSALYRSLDQGASWQKLTLSGIAPPMTFLGFLGPLRIDPEDPSTFYLVAGGTLYRSRDQGASWSEVAPLPPIAPPPSVAFFDYEPDLVLDPERPGVLYLSTYRQGALTSLDGGATWSALGSGLAAPHLGALVVVGTGENETLLAASDGGAWALPVGQALAPPAPPASAPSTSPDLPGFRVWVRITDGDGVASPVREEPVCIPETLCVSGAVPGRSEVFVRVVGPKPNGRLWPTLVKFTTSQVEVWIEQIASGELRYYDLPGARPGVDELPGLFDRNGFVP